MATPVPPPPQTPRTYTGADGQTHDQFGNTYGTPKADGTINGATGVYNAGSPAPVATPPQPPSEPAVLSSTSIDDLNAKNKDKITSLSKKGSAVGEDGNMYDASGSMMSAPEGAVWDEGSGQFKYNGQSYGAADFYGTNGSGGDADWKAIQDLFAPLKASLDSATLGQVNAIQQSFEALKADQTAYNAQAEKSRSRALLVGGASRYAPLSASSTMLAQTSFGLRQLQSLDAQENSAIAQAQAAQQSGEMQLMDKAISMAENIRQQKQTKAADVMASIQKANDALREAHIQASRDEAVAGLMSQGITDPAKILNLLNKNQDGTSTGGDFSADEVAKAIKNLIPTHSTGIYKFTNDDVGKMLAAGMNANQIQATQDYYNGQGDVPTLTASQQAAVHKALGGAAAAGTKEFKFTPTQVSELLSGNFTQTDVQNMQADVAVHGIDAVTADMPPAQAALIKRVLANADTVAKIGSDETTLTREKLSEIYGIPDDEDNDGIFGTGESHSAQLDSLESIVDRYKDYYSDKEILEMIQKQTSQ